MGLTMKITELANKTKDLSRAIYIGLVAGQVSDNNQLLIDIHDLECVLSDIKEELALEACGYHQESDLAGLAKMENQ
jgi:hypothetical protein